MEQSMLLFKEASLDVIMINAISKEALILCHSNWKFQFIGLRRTTVASSVVALLTSCGQTRLILNVPENFVLLQMIWRLAASHCRNVRNSTATT
jgi:hypothetical protein